MSTDRATDTAEAAPLPIDRADGSAELDIRSVFSLLFNDPDIRVFTFTALGSLGMMFLILFQQGNDIGGLLIVIFGLCGILLRWTPSPVFVLLILVYFMIFPFGVPGYSYQSYSEIDDGRFRITDLLLVLSAVVYLACQYRILGFVQQAIAFDGPIRVKSETPTRRPATLIRPAEFAIMLGMSAALVVAGQVIWWLANAFEVVPGETIPLTWAEAGRTTREHLPGAKNELSPPGSINTGATRFIILVGIMFFGTLTARLIFGYWRLRTMASAEGKMILLDGSWSETSRDRQRIEKWRIWGRHRVTTEANATGKAATKEMP